MSTFQGVVVVTGGASGIGEAVARRFAGQGGFTVVIGDLDEARGAKVAQALRDEGADVHFVGVDLASQASIDAFSAHVTEAFGAPVALINSGGILQNAVRLQDMDIAEFDRLQAINVRGTLLTSRALGKHMCARGTGSIINLCSLTSFRPSAQIGYAVGKASLHMLTQVLAAEWGPSGVRVNAVAPGYTLTPGLQARIDSGERDPQVVFDKSALRRFVEPREVAEAVYFLCSPAASAITGSVLPVDCGWLVTSAYTAYASQP